MANGIKIGSTNIGTVKLGSSQVSKIYLGTTVVWANLPELSLDFESSSAQRISMSDGNFGAYDRAKFAISLWVKRESTTTFINGMYGHSDGGDTAFQLFFTAADKIGFETTTDGSTLAGRILTTATYSSTAAFYHIFVHYDSANATAGDRIKLWVDGSEVTTFDTDVNPTASIFNSTAAITIGAITAGGGQPFDGLIYCPSFFSGSLPAVTDVRDSGTGLPKDVSSLPGIFSFVDNFGGVVGSDGVLATDWTNVNTVVTSSTIPT